MPAPSSTSSSEPRDGRDGRDRREPHEPAEPKPKSRPRHLLLVALGCLLLLLGFEAAVNVLLQPTRVDRKPGALARYTGGGLSIERKLHRALNTAQEADVVWAGFIDRETGSPPPPNWNDARVKMALYGMSFTQNLEFQIEAATDDVAIIGRYGPAAPLNHAYALFEADPLRPEADVVLVGVLSTSVPYARTMTGLGYTAEAPAPYAYPRFDLVDGELRRTDPLVTELDDFVQSFRENGERWHDHLQRLYEHDALLKPFVYEANLADYSTLLNLARKAWAQRAVGQNTDAIYDPSDGYATDDHAVAAIPVLLQRMHEQCAQDGQRLIVALFHAQGEPGHLDAWLKPMLEAEGIEVLSTVDHFSSEDPLNFLPDAHYTYELDGMLAEHLLSLLAGDEPFKRKSTPPGEPAGSDVSSAR